MDSVRYCGREFSSAELEWMRELITNNPRTNRTQLSRLVCAELGWLKPDGGLKEMSCRVAMLRMERDRLLVLPPSSRRSGNGRRRPRLTSASDPQELLELPAGELGELELRVVKSGKSSPLWNELVERYHYLGHQPLPGAQMRYLVFGGGGRLLALLGFGAAAWKVAPRDEFIGWTVEQRERNLHLVVNNARFLILPWVRSKNLASRILAKVARQLPTDWQTRYSYRPILLETFVECERFSGTCYRAANWIYVGRTKGRGKLDRTHRQVLPIKDIFLYPLHKHFRQTLQTTE